MEFSEDTASDLNNSHNTSDSIPPMTTLRQSPTKILTGKIPKSGKKRGHILDGSISDVDLLDLPSSLACDGDAERCKERDQQNRVSNQKVLLKISATLYYNDTPKFLINFALCLPLCWADRTSLHRGINHWHPPSGIAIYEGRLLRRHQSPCATHPRSTSSFFWGSPKRVKGKPPATPSVRVEVGGKIWYLS